MIDTASGRHRRPLAFALTLVASLALVAAAAAGGAVAPRRTLVILLRAHKAHVTHLVGSPLVGVVPATTVITGGETVLPVVARHGRWLKVELPGRPNGHTGWISSSHTVTFLTVWHVVIDPSRREVSVYRSGHVVRVFRAVVGKPSTPTPAGEFFVEESIDLGAAGIGAPFALALSARSNVLQEFDGGPGQIALHGLHNVGGVPGTATSHGCVRLDDAAITWLATHIGPGVPVTITG